MKHDVKGKGIDPWQTMVVNLLMHCRQRQGEIIREKVYQAHFASNPGQTVTLMKCGSVHGRWYPSSPVGKVILST